MNSSDEWITSVEAIKLLLREHIKPSAVLLRRLKAGIIEARASTLEMESSREANALIPQSFWKSAEMLAPQDWKSGDLLISDFDGRRGAYGVKFRTKDIIELLPGEEVDPEPPRNKGGRPPASWWDDFWIEIMRLIFAGKLDSKRPEKIKAAMLQWAVDNNHDLSPRYAGMKAHKLCRALWPEGTN